MILETRHLRLVAAVAEHGTLTRAGRVLHLTQSGLSRQLLDLETRLGLPLFHRLRKRYRAHARGRGPAGGPAARPAPAQRPPRGSATSRRPPVEKDVFAKRMSPGGVMPRRVSAVPLTEAILELVKGGAGIAVLARWAVAPHLKTGELKAVRLTRHGLERRWRAAMLRQRPVPLHVREFAGLLAAGPTVLSRRAVRA